LSGLILAGKTQTKNWPQNAQNAQNAQKFKSLKMFFCAFCAFLWRKDFVLFDDFNFTWLICRILRSKARRLSKAKSKPGTAAWP